MLNTTDIDLSWAAWRDYFLTTIDEFIPKAILPARKNRLWLSKQIIQAVRHRNALFRRAKSTADSVHFAAYKSA